MKSMDEKIKRLRMGVIRTFLLLFVPHIFVCAITLQFTKNPIDVMIYQFCWFAIYFSISFSSYVFAPEIIKKRHG